MFSNKQGLHKRLYLKDVVCVHDVLLGGDYITSPPPNLMYIPPLCVFYHWKFDHRQILWHCSLTEHLYVFVCMGGGGGGGGGRRRKKETERVLPLP